MVCRKPAPPLHGVCGDQRCGRTAKPCKLCGESKVGRSPFCSWCRRDRLDGAKLCLDGDWLGRREGRDKRSARRPRTGPPVPGVHWCAGCRDWLHPRWFLRWKDYTAGKPVPPRCRPCRSQAGHDARIRKEFGIDPVEYKRLLTIQGGVCAICSQPPVTVRLAVDHAHDDTTAIRGLLCSRCNHDLLGAAHDSIEILQRAVDYLRSPPAQKTREFEVVHL